MAATIEMGEVDEMHSKEESSALNGDIDMKNNGDLPDEEAMEVDQVCDSSKNDLNNIENNSAEEGTEDGNDVVENSVENIEANSVEENTEDESSVVENNAEVSSSIDENSQEHTENSCDARESETTSDTEERINQDIDKQSATEDEVSAKDNEDPLSSENKNANEGTIELNDSGEDIMIVDGDIPKENGNVSESSPKITNTETVSDDAEVITLDTPVKKKKHGVTITQSSPRRSSRNLNKQKSYIESDKEEEEEEAEVQQNSDEESDIEEILPEDPLAVADPLQSEKRKGRSTSSAIVVKDTKRLVEIASKSNPSNAGGKKEPTLVIIDTNSILSGRGPVPLVTPPPQPKPLPKPPMPSSKSTMPSFPMLPMALPAQGIYPPNMRATITPIPINTAPPAPPAPPKAVPPPAPPPVPVLPTLTDDMFVVEAPSFIVPYVYEKPPLKDFKGFVKDIQEKLAELRKKEESEAAEREKDEKSETESDEVKEKETEKAGAEKQDGEADKEKGEATEDAAKTEGGEKSEEKKELGEADEPENSGETKKTYSYFSSPLGKFFIDIGTSLVQEYVQTDLLKQQKRKRDREGGQNSQTNKTIMSLIKNLEFTKEHNEPYKMEMKKCEFCSFKTESSLAMAFHLETPHMKNFVYRCNFCPYEVRSPHDILFHMEAEHAVRGRLERAPAFHQCPNCPFEDNQKGKLSRHLVACMRKFKPERNLEPPVDWEPPAKIPRVPRMKQTNLAATATVYQALSKNQQYQMFSKMQQNSVVHRGRGRPSLGTAVMTKPPQQPMLRPNSGMMYKQTMSGGSVLVPTSYQLSGNQLYQVVGGQELGGRIGPLGPMAFVPNMSSAASTVTIQPPNTNKPKPTHQPSISITPLPRAASAASVSSSKPGDSNSKNSFVICEICDGYIKDLEQLRNHMQWIHKVKIHPKMIYNRPPLNCQKCQFRFFTDQGLERHLLGSHGLVTSSMQEAANKSKDAGRCPVCGRVYQWKLLNHVARDHNMTLKPAHLSYKCTVCTATFGMYKQFENHVYSAHSVVAKRVMDKKGSGPSPSKNDTLLKPLKINDEITIIPQPTKGSGIASTSKEGSPSGFSTGSRNGTTKY